MRISDWSSDVCSSDLRRRHRCPCLPARTRRGRGTRLPCGSPVARRHRRWHPGAATGDDDGVFRRVHPRPRRQQGGGGDLSEIDPRRRARPVSSAALTLIPPPMDAPPPPPPILRNRDLLLFLTGRVPHAMAVLAMTGWG